MARTVFHELAHQPVFVPGDMLFKKAFATAVEEIGLRRWLARRTSAEQGAAFAAHASRQMALRTLLEEYRGRLQALYARRAANDHRRHAKAELLAALRRVNGGRNPRKSGAEVWQAQAWAEFLSAKRSMILVPLGDRWCGRGRVGRSP